MGNVIVPGKSRRERERGKKASIYLQGPTTKFCYKAELERNRERKRQGNKEKKREGAASQEKKEKKRGRSITRSKEWFK